MATNTPPYSFLTESKHPSELGMLGPYRVIEELGRGGMGYVFRAEDTRLQRSVALKVMNEKIAATKNSRVRFISEARAMAAVQHDNVATIFEVGERNSTPFMAMEMLTGETLEAARTRKERPNFAEVIETAKQIASGLAAAHQKGIVHRDIKPANIWIEANTGRVKILDFGLALAQTPVDQLAGRGSVIGTPGYLSPEQARSEPLDNRSDLFSLGAVLYELCTGRLPLQAKSVAGQLIAILAHDPTPLRDLNPDIPVPLANLIHRLLSREPRDRPASATALRKELDVVFDECHAKSEVALALNKLQAGLNEVVSKNQTNAIDAFASEPLDFASEPREAQDDPFASLPETLTTAKPGASAGTHAGAGMYPVPTAAPHPYAKPATGKPTGKPTVQAKWSWQTHWPIAAISLAVAVAIPIVLYALWFLEPATVAMVNNPSGATASPNLSDSENSGHQAGAKQGNAGSGQNAGVQAKFSPAKTKAGTGKNAGGPGGDMIVIRTSDGRGADTTVGRAMKASQGAAALLTIQENAQRPRESKHAYLRFDLAGLPVPREQIESVVLTLVIPGEKLPADASVQIYDASAQVPATWSESGPSELKWAQSPSANNVASLVRLAETELPKESDSTNNKRTVVRIGSPELTRLVRDSPSELVTLAIVGSSGDNTPIRFSTKENQQGGIVPNKAPSLLIRTGNGAK